MCGEKESGEYWNDKHKGSPPHVRGKAPLLCACVCEPGITPACAGKSALVVRVCMRTGDHPRMCGEKPVSRAAPPPSIGSPPHVRGKVSGILLCVATYRITPACAGKSDTVNMAQGVSRDHPRMCGEKGLSTFWSRNHSGSPPHVRGKGYV